MLSKGRTSATRSQGNNAQGFANNPAANLNSRVLYQYNFAKRRDDYVNVCAGLCLGEGSPGYSILWKAVVHAREVQPHRNKHLMH